MKRPKQEPPKSAFTYIRVSTNRQVDGTSLERQRRETIEYCREHGLRHLGHYEDRGAHAKTEKRPEFQRMLLDARKLKGKLGHIVVFSGSRFARRSAVHHKVRQELESSGIVLRSVKERFDETPHGRWTESVTAANAELDNDLRSEASADGMYDRALSGRWVWPAKLGYEHVHRSLGGPSLCQDEQRAPLIREAFTMMATGKRSKEEVRRHVTAMGLRTRRGQPLAPQAFAKLLENPIYAGRVVCRKWKIDVQGDFEPIVPHEVFDAVQAILRRKRPEERRHALDNPVFPLRRFVKCWWCGAPTTGAPSTSRSGKKYYYYRCREPKCVGNGEKRGIGHVETIDLHEQFADLLRSLSPEDGFGQLFRDIVRDVWKRRHGEAQELRAKLRASVAELEARERKLTEAYAVKGSIDESAYTALRAEYRAAANDARAELDRFSKDDLDEDAAADLGARLLDDPAGLWESLSPPAKVRLQRFIYPEGVPYDGEAFGTAVTAPIFGWLRPPAEAGGKMVTPRGFEPLSPG